ncbi:cAMP-regulated phosphoprotein 19-like [Ctenocephalides felis]|uniref:cAMP-regulated phosphoprotein 19-like n=1 Tax=Ctenocephalides felis TaxID=7515 RepID=UPI000E6E44E0|nr:cAMP-regulated phosphoprotein 19-like [Ctenocephalides felis]
MSNSEPKKLSSQDLEEEKLQAKFPIIPGATAYGDSGLNNAFLQRKLIKSQRKYFDSGDYQMAKQKIDQTGKPVLAVNPTGDVIPTPETVPVRKTSNIQQKFN